MTLKQLIGVVVSLPIWLGGWWGIWWIGHLCAKTWNSPLGEVDWYDLPMLFSSALWIAFGAFIGRALFRKELR